MVEIQMSLIKSSLSEDEDFSVLLKALEGRCEGIHLTYSRRNDCILHSVFYTRVSLKNSASIFR